MKTFNCSGTFSIHMYDIEIEAETEDEARKKFRKVCKEAILEEPSWNGRLDWFECEEVKDE